jgi:hypothetical protein
MKYVRSIVLAALLMLSSLLFVSPPAQAARTTCVALTKDAVLVNTANKSYCFNSTTADHSGYTPTASGTIYGLKGVHMGRYNHIVIFYYLTCSSQGCLGPYSYGYNSPGYAPYYSFSFSAYYVYAVTLAVL